MKMTILGLDDIGNEHAFIVGAKAYTLATLRRQGFPVPDGFVVTAELYRIAVQSDAAFQQAVARFRESSPGPEQAAWLTGDIQSLIGRAVLPPTLAKEILGAWDRLGAATVAVRSSANIEDLPDAAFAGQYESYLNVGRDDLLTAIRRCWISLWSPRATFYRLQRGIETSDVAMAVLIQRMVQGQSSGVAFTANPLNGNRRQIVINRASGQGDHVVGGTVTPETVTLKKGAKSSERRLDDIIALASAIERVLGTPQDVEWVDSGDSIHVVQARPITALAADRRRKGPLKDGVTALLLEYFPKPPFPFDRSVVLPLIQATLDVGRGFGLKPPRSDRVLVLDPDGTIRIDGRAPTPAWIWPAGIVIGTRHAIVGLRRDPSIWARQHWPVFEREIADRNRRTTEGLDDEALLDELGQAIELMSRMFKIRAPYFTSEWLAMGLLPAALRLVYRDDAQAMAFALLGGLDHPTARMNVRLRRLAGLAASSATTDSVLSRNMPTIAAATVEFQSEFDSFLRDFGCRTNVLVPLPSSLPWHADPAHLLRLISTLSETVGHANTNVEEQNAFVIALNRVEALSGLWRALGIRKLLLFLIDYNRRVREERDWVVYGYDVAVDGVRRLTHLLADRLKSKGRIKLRGDWKFLTLDEASDALRMREQEGAAGLSVWSARIEQRRLSRYRSVSLWRPPTKAVRFKGPVLLSGAAASPGRVVGRARIILSDSESAALGPGDILVCEATSPAWTPLFARAGAVVTNIGGILSHAAIVAREYAIPAVLGTTNATEIMREGILYIVDGSRGVVESAPPQYVHGSR